MAVNLMIAIIDYGMGNLRSVEKGLAKVGIPAVITSSADIIRRAKAVVLPGVGAFGDAMDNLAQLDLIPAIEDAVQSGKPFLGICLGMQLLFTFGEESGGRSGLDFIKGRVPHFPPGLKVPQIGWNQVHFQQSHPLLAGIPDNTYFYFVHSYYVQPENPAIVGGTTYYGLEFASILIQENVFGVQFHPEKSSRWGLQLLKNFGELV